MHILWTSHGRGGREGRKEGWRKVKERGRSREEKRWRKDRRGNRRTWRREKKEPKRRPSLFPVIYSRVCKSVSYPWPKTMHERLTTQYPRTWSLLIAAHCKSTYFNVTGTIYWESHRLSWEADRDWVIIGEKWVSPNQKTSLWLMNHMQSWKST